MNSSRQNDLLRKIEQLNSIGSALSKEANLPELFEKILLGAKELTNADGGSLYIIENNLLRFELIHTTSLNLHMGGTSAIPVSFPSIPLYLDDGRPNQQMVVTRTALEKRTFNIPDAYASPDFDFSGTREFDSRTGYRSRSFLAVPMLDHTDRVIGVLQLINAITPGSNRVQPFSDEDERLAVSLASQAAIAFSRKMLIDGLEELLESLVKLIASAIDDKSPHTGTHCRRVPAITMALANAVNDDDGPDFGSVTFDDHALHELEIAAWLHDCGKITTPEYVVDKQTRLETIFDRIELINTRLEVLARDAEIAALKRLLTQHDLTTDAHHDDPCRARLAELSEIRSFLMKCNTEAEVDDQARRRIERLASLSYVPHTGGRQPLLNEDEVDNLSVPKGTLTPEERAIINSHIEASIRMLSALPFPDHLKKVPEIAGGHHERMDGAGYPKGVPAAELSLQARILALADVFEALTANDRVYHKPNTLSEALHSLAAMAAEGHIDPGLLDLFISKGVYRNYAREALLPEQIDEVDADRLRKLFMP